MTSSTQARELLAAELQASGLCYDAERARYIREGSDAFVNGVGLSFALAAIDKALVSPVPGTHPMTSSTQARELLAAELEADGWIYEAEEIRLGRAVDEQCVALRAIDKALSRTPDTVCPQGPSMTTVIEAEELLAAAMTLLTKAAEDWRIHVGCVERANAARPSIEATKAERALYQERYCTMVDARQEHWRSAIALAKWLGENGNLPAIEKALSLSRADLARAAKARGES